jgi:hypothetical protein
MFLYSAQASARRHSRSESGQPILNKRRVITMRRAAADCIFRSLRRRAFALCRTV